MGSGTSGQHAVGGAGEGHRGVNSFAGALFLHHALGNGGASAGIGFTFYAVPFTFVDIVGIGSRRTGGRTAVVAEAAVYRKCPGKASALVVIKILAAVFGAAPGGGVVVNRDHRVGSVVVLLHCAAHHSAIVIGGKSRYRKAHNQQHSQQSEIIKINLETGDWIPVYELNVEQGEQVIDAYGSNFIISGVGQSLDETLAQGTVTSVFLN